MAFCTNCGQRLAEGAHFCGNCGNVVGSDGATSQRKTVCDGDLHKCPNCGELLDSFVVRCPSCGYELRGATASSAVKEFALKLEAIEANREYETPYEWFKTGGSLERISKTDAQKISLIKSFSVPNTKEDMLEFMILATSSIDFEAYDSTKLMISRGEKELNSAWLAKVQQVYKKAKMSGSSDAVITEIYELYDECNKRIIKTAKRGRIKRRLKVGAFLVPWFIVVVIVAINGYILEPREEAKEIERLDNIVIEVETALEKKEFKHALSIADSMDYQRYDIELERKWDLQREYWTDKVITEAKKHGFQLDYNPSADIDKANSRAE